jgi:protein subunit release factor B
MAGPSLKPTTRDRLNKRMAKLGIVEGDFREKFILGSGKGGQKVNKTSSCVSLKHIPTGIEVKCQRSRSQDLNRYYARCDICERFEEKILGEKTEKRQKQEKIRRQKRRRSRRAKGKMLDDKSKHAKKKTLRRSVNPEE